MDNSARVIALTITPGFFCPCERINRGIDIASRTHACPFKVEIIFNFISGGVNQPPVTSTQLVSATTYMALLDPMWIRAQGVKVAMHPQPDHGSLVTCTAVIYINDATGVRVNQCNAEVSAFTAP